MDSECYSEFIAPTQVVDSTHPAVIEFTQHHCKEANSSENRAIQLYYAIRDGIRYDPYRIDLTILGMRASTTLLTQRGWCVSKAVLLTSCCRSIGIPARLGFADVRNHLSTQKLRQRMGTDIFYWHGFTEMLLADKWVKATPVFGRRLCQKLRLLPLEFNGHDDALHHPYDAEGHHHMEYINHRGVYSDLPIKKMILTFDEQYNFSSRRPDSIGGNFDEDIAIETRT